MLKTSLWGMLEVERRLHALFYQSGRTEIDQYIPKFLITVYYHSGMGLSQSVYKSHLYRLHKAIFQIKAYIFSAYTSFES